MSGAFTNGANALGLDIGIEHYGASTSDNRIFDGRITDFRYFATALTADEIMNLYKMGHVA